MKKLPKRIILIFILIIFCALLFSNVILALNPDNYDPGKLTYREAAGFFEKAAPIIKIITNVGIIGSVLAITIIGLSYMLGSTSEQKAQIKEKILPLICGCLLIIGTFSLVKLIASVATGGDQEEQESISSTTLPTKPGVDRIEE